MEPTHAIEQRLTELEIKASYAEDTVDRLNEVVVRQQGQIDQLLRAWAELAGQHPAADDAAAPRPHDELPPHY